MLKFDRPTRSLFMTRGFPGSPILNLKVGEAVFPLEKRYLFKTFRLFRSCRHLLSDDDYEVSTEVSPEVFQAFLDCVSDGTLPISEENCESFWFLADEFEIDQISQKCDSMMASHPKSLPEAKLPVLPSIHREVDVGPGHRVILAMKTGSKTYDTIRSRKEIENFVRNLRFTAEDKIEIEGIEGKDRPVEKTVAAVYANAVATFPESRIKKQFLAMTLWELQSQLAWWNIDSMTYCLNRLNEIAPTTFERARLLLLSQCHPLYPDKFIQLPNADLCIIGDAIQMLKQEKNANRDDANRLLERLKDTGRYEDLLKTDEESG
jgi:hypothetical protein